MLLLWRMRWWLLGDGDLFSRVRFVKWSWVTGLPKFRLRTIWFGIAISSRTLPPSDIDLIARSADTNLGSSVSTESPARSMHGAPLILRHEL